MAERLLSQMQAAELGFLPSAHGVTLRDEVRSCEIRKALNVGPHIRVDSSQLRLFCHVTRMPQGSLTTQVFLVGLAGKLPRS